MVRRLALAAAWLAALSACKPAEPAGSLQKAFAALPRSPLCAQNIPLDWTSTWPVPTGKPGEYAVLFYSLDRSAKDKSGLPRVRVTQPRGRGVFTDDGRASACARDPVGVKPLEGERYARAAMDLDEQSFDAAEALLLELTEVVSRWHATGKRPDKKTVAAFWAQFELLAEPALLARYYGMNPGFWEWLRRENGRSLAAPPR